jgi:photosystem II stability/assembly factor-like uncharacterized protein
MIHRLSNRFYGLAFVLFLVIFTAPGCDTPDEVVPLIRGFDWQLQNSGTTESLRGVCAVSDTIAWCSGAGGTVSRTVDGGATWHVINVPEAGDVDFRDIEAFDENTAVIMGVASPAKFFKTEDGGRTWTLVYLNETKAVFFNSMDFWDRMNGIAVSDPVEGRFLLARTTDGGNSWSPIPPEQCPEAISGEAQFAASGTCLRVQGDNDVRFVTGGAAARLFFSSDKGDHWRVMDTPIIKGESSTGIYSVAFQGPDCGIVTGGDYKIEDQRTKVAALTHDGGKTWSLIPESQIGGLRECAVFFPLPRPDTILVIGPSGAEFSIDGGDNWTATPIKNIHSVSLSPSGAIGWGVGVDGKIVRFTTTF